MSSMAFTGHHLPDGPLWPSHHLVVPLGPSGCPWCQPLLVQFTGEHSLSLADPKTSCFYRSSPRGNWQHVTVNKHWIILYTHSCQEEGDPKLKVNTGSVARLCCEAEWINGKGLVWHVEAGPYDGGRHFTETGWASTLLPGPGDTFPPFSQKNIRNLRNKLCFRVWGKNTVGYTICWKNVAAA